MKKLFIYSIIIVILFSCSSPKKIINIYLEEELIQNAQTKNNIIKKKGDVKEALRIFRQVRMSKIRYKDSVYIAYGSKLYNEKHYIGFKEKYKNDTLKESWNNSDYKNLNIRILPEDSMFKYKKSFKGKYYNYDINYYVISKPIINELENVAFFSILKSSNKKGIEYHKVIVYKKEDNKWIKVEEVPNTELY